SDLFTLTIDQAPSIISANSTTFTVGTAGSFTFTSTGFPTAALLESGTLPSGISFVDNSDGTATLSGTPAAGTGGTYVFTISASNGVSPDASQSFTLTIDQAPSIISANSTTFTVGTSGSFTITSTGFPTAALLESGTLPSGISFVDNGDGTATLSGTPAAGTGGSYPFTISASNGVSPDASQNFTLTIDQAPAITSASSTTFTVGTAASFTITSTGFPTAAIIESGTLPGGISLVDNSDGTATLSGTPDAGTGGSYPFSISGSNGVAPDATQSFTLTVDQAPAITSADSASFAFGQGGSFTVTSTGFPKPTFSETGTLPSGVALDSITGAIIVDGSTPAGVFSFTVTASNGVNPDAAQSFTLTVRTPVGLSPALAVGGS